MSAALNIHTVEPVERPVPDPREPKCVTTAAGLWKRLSGLREREQLTMWVCLETSLHGRGRRRRPTQERVVIAFRSGGRLRVFDPGAAAGPLREVTGAHDLAGYFDDVAGFSYVVAR